MHNSDLYGEPIELTYGKHTIKYHNYRKDQMNTTSDKCHERPNSLSYSNLEQDTVKNRKSDSFRQEKRKIKCHKKDQRMHSLKVTRDLKPKDNAFKCDRITRVSPSIELRHENSKLNKYAANEFMVTLVKKDDGFGFAFDGGIPGQLEIKVTCLVPGGIADLNGQIKIGDCITTVDGHNVIGKTHCNVFEYLQRETNKVVTFGIKRIIHNDKLSTTCSLMHHLVLYQGSTEFRDEKQPANYHNRKVHRSGVQDFNVTLCNNDDGFGFGFNGGFLDQPEILITHIKPGSKADLSGQMQIGDCIISINDHSLMGKSHQYVFRYLEEREGNTTTFGIRRIVHNVSKSSQPALKLCKQELSFTSCNNIFLGGSHDHSSISQSDSLILNNLTETTKSTLIQHCDKKTFYQTTGFHVALRKLISYRKVILTGGHGCGKTSLGIELLNYFSKTETEMFTRKSPFIIRIPNHWHVVVEPGQNVIILLDDIFGKVRLDENSLRKWSCIFPDMQTCINDSRMCVFVIITVRDNILSNISERIQRMELFQNANNCTVNLNIESSLSIDDKREILIRHFQFPRSRQIFVLCVNHEMCPDEKNSIHINPGEIENIISIPKLFAYPLCCYNYVNNETYLQRGPRFFRQPYEIMYNDIKHICEDDKLAYFLFCLILLSKSNEFLRKNTADNYFGLNFKLYSTLLEICNKPGCDSS
ncbi:uncharacterized protein LOC127715538 isoform X2 [Mytilus californianus]|nr:uncharacterized protein LOC127715538 isoform X2 [Mytilus californianus]